MPRGPKGEGRPADVIGNAVHVMRIATGEAEEDRGRAPGRAKAAGRYGVAFSRPLTFVPGMKSCSVLDCRTC